MDKGLKPAKFELNRIQKIVPKMAFDGTVSFEEWKIKARAKLEELLGLPFEPCDPKFEIEYERDSGDFFETRFSFQSEDDYFVPCHLCVPKNLSGQLPLIICIQGHSTGMHISLGRPESKKDEWAINNGDRDFAISAMKVGFCALTIEQRSMGECGGTPEPDCKQNALDAIISGRTIIGERVWDVSRAIDMIYAHFPQIDKEKIYCMGNSGGGTTTFYAACMDERIKAAMPSCAICTYEGSIARRPHCSCNYIPNIALYFDMGDLGGLIAPRPYVIVSGIDDQTFPIEGAKKCFETSKKIYEAAGAGDKIAHVVGNEGHRFYADDAWPVFKKLIN